MEQAVNQFNKGLQLDTHPMVLGNDTLSDALNATFITMNGNEVVLQNDMGNRRIDNAFLPSGYLPLGMKEYGGVIYVAAYNPLTNRGQVGSFPSPLRKVNIDNPNGTGIDFNRFIAKDTDDNGNNIYYLNKEYIIIPISDKIVLHTGDKFSIYSNEIQKILKYLTKLGETKNNLFTFLIGIFNSQNEFIDISNKLKLWDIDGEKYFINKDFTDTIDTTIADSELLKARNRLAINTYSLKMSSPLYLKAIVNHINDISYSITGEISGSRTVNLEIEVTFYYNCIDYILDKGTFEIYFNDRLCSNPEILKEPTYSLEIELYTATYLYKINDLRVSSEEISGSKKYEYEIKFPLLHNFEGWSNLLYNPIYIKALNKKGELDLSKLNSDTLIFKGYRYYNDTANELTTLIINLESYPKKESNLYFCTVIKDPTKDPSNGNDIVYTVINDKHKPGTGTITTQFSYKNLEKRKLYKFEFYYYNDLIEKEHKGVEKGFYITTPIFNGNYVGDKGVSLNDYINLGLVNSGDKKIHYSYDLMSNVYIDDFSKIQDILLSPILTHSVSSVPIENKVTISGNYIQPLSSDVEKTSYIVTEENKIKNTIDISASVNNIDIYPSEVESILKIESTNNVIKDIERSINEDVITKDNGIYKYSENLKENKDPNNGISSDVIEISEEYTSLNIKLNLQRIELVSTSNVNNIIKGHLEKKSIYCDHLISSFGNLIKKYYYGQNLMDYITLRPPYITIDWESTDYVSIVSSTSLDELKEATYNKAKEEHRAEKVNGKSRTNTFYIDEVARDGISDFILSHCDGQLIVGEYSGDDYIGGFTPCMLNSNQSAKYVKMDHFKRFWLKINKREYIPIFVYGHVSGSSPEFNAIDDFYNDNGAYNLVFSKIPHYYEYETGGKTLLEKIINPNTMNKTIEFEVDSNVEVVITENIQLKVETPLYYLLISKYTQQYSNNISEKIFFKEGKISSNEEFIEEVENLSNYHVNSAVMFGDEDSHILLIRDCEGNIIDPLYVYYDDSEQNPQLTGNVFKKSYIADKFYVPDLDIYMPEIKNSRKLYGGEFGEHGLINEYVYPTSSERGRILNNGGDVPNDLSSSDNLWDKTFILWEGGDQSRNHQLPLRTKNIFNRTVILNYYLTTKRINSWISYDDYIRDLNNN